MSRRDATFVVGLVSGSHVINHAYMVLLAPAFPLMREEFGVSLGTLGLALGLVNLVVTLGQLPLGHVSDSHSHGAVLIASLAVGTVGTAMAALAPDYRWLLVSAVVIGVGVAGHHPSHYPLISASTRESHRSRAYSAHGFAGAMGLALPFAAVPAAVATGLGWREAFAAIAVLGLCYTVLTVLALRRVPRSITRAGALANEDASNERRGATTDSGASIRTVGRRVRRLLARLRAYLRTLARAPLVILLTALWFVNSVAVWGIRSYAATLLDAGYGLAPGTASLVASAMLVVGAAVLLVGGYLADRFGPLPMLFLGYGSLVVLATVLATELVPLLAAGGLVLLLAATIDVSRPARATMTDLASARRDVGKNFAVITLGISAGGAIAPPLFGGIIETAGLGPAFLGIAATAVVALGISIAVARLERISSADTDQPID